MTESTDSDGCTADSYRVRCDDCDLKEYYDDGDDAILRMFNHANVRDHSVGVSEVSD